MKLNQFKMIADYKSGMTLREVAARHGCTMQWVHHVIRRRKHNLMRPRGGFRRFIEAERAGK